MRITEDVRAYAKEHGITGEEALEVGMKEQSEAFKASGGELHPTPGA
jgi:phosphomethylpyrimidine synthase